MQRIQLVVSELVGYADKNADGPFVNHLWVIKSMFESFTEELNGASDEKLSAWMQEFGMLMQWCAYGDSDCLPPAVLEYLRKNHANMLQLESATCSQSWKGDDGLMYHCSLLRGHSGECFQIDKSFSDTVEER